GPKALVSLPQYWSRGNLKDSIQGVLCALSDSALQEVVFTVPYASLRAAGYEPPPGTELIRRFHGRAYFDFTLMQWVFYDGFGLLPEVTIRALGGHHPSMTVPPGDPMKGREGRRRTRAQLGLFRALWNFEKRRAATFQQHIADTRKAAREPLESKNRDEL